MAVLLLLAALTQPTVPEETPLQGLVDQLGSDFIEKLEAAMRKLFEIGPAVEPLLDEAIRTRDAEIAWRARKILETLTAYRKEVEADVSCLLLRAMSNAKRGDIDASIDTCDLILKIDPRYPVALELKEAAVRARHDGAAHLDLMRKVATLRGEIGQEFRLPRKDTFHFPARKDWPPLRSTITTVLTEDRDGDGQLSIRRKIQTMKIDMSFEDTKLEDILAFIRDFSGLNILIDATVVGDLDLEKPMTFKVKDLVLEGVLKLLLSPLGLEYRITQERVVLITARHCSR